MNFGINDKFLADADKAKYRREHKISLSFFLFVLNEVFENLSRQVFGVVKITKIVMIVPLFLKYAVNMETLIVNCFLVYGFRKKDRLVAVFRLQKKVLRVIHLKDPGTT